ncbi:MAG: DUF11 domain-containing protein, partial [Chloroflexi bacterium]|nr:DUF11 domain-containing protein [Chloroflexota bacterium]
LTYVASSVAATAGTPSYSGGNVLWNGSVAVGTPVVITYRATVNSPLPDGTLITNTAQVDNGLGTVTSTATATTTTTLPHFTDSSKSVSPTSMFPGGVLTYTIVIFNNGTAAGNVTLTDPVPANTTYAASSSSSGNAPTFASNTLSWSGTVNVGSRVTITMRVTVNGNAQVGSTISNTATLDDGTGEDDAFSATANVVSGAPIISSSSKTASASSASPGDVVTYTIRVVNTGTGDTTSWVTDTVPTGLAYVADSAASSSTTPPTYDSTSNQVRWNGTVSASNTVTVTFRATVNSNAATSVVNTASIADSSGNQTSKTATINIGNYRLFLPVIVNAYAASW